MNRLGIGIVGCGGAALDMARAIAELPTAFVAATHDREPSSAAVVSGRFGGVVHATIEDLLSEVAVDVVYVALPHHLLAPTAHRALSAGKHALVEKPMGLDVASIRSLQRAAAAGDRRLGVVLELRESDAVRTARRLVHDGAIGPVRAVRIRTIINKPLSYWHASDGEFRSWRARRATAGGGVVLMNCIHQLDIARYITGLSFVRAMAEAATQMAPVEVEDTAAAVLRLSNGGVTNVVAAAHSPGAADEERIEIDGAAGRVDVNPYGPGQVRLFLNRPWADYPAGQWLDLRLEPVDTHLELVRRFVGAVATGAEVTADADDAAAALATVLAIYQSAETGAVVAVSPGATA